MSEKYKSDFTGFQVDDSVDRAKIGGILENQIIQRLFKLENTGEYVYSHNDSVQTQIPISKTFDNSKSISTNDVLSKQFNLINTKINELINSTIDYNGQFDELNDHINKNIVENLSLGINGDEISIITQTINLLNDSKAQDKDILPLANSVNAGLMSLEDYKTLYKLVSKVSNLEGTEQRLLYITEDVLKEIEYSNNTYSPAFYINNEIYYIKNNTIYKVLKNNLRNFTINLKDNINLINRTFRVNFWSNKINFSKIILSEDSIYYSNGQADILVYSITDGWTEAAYKLILFSDGEDIATGALVEFVKNNSDTIELLYNISNNKSQIEGITYTFSNLELGGKITRSVNAGTINSFVTHIYDENGQQAYLPPFRGVAVIIYGTNHVWRYYINTSDESAIGWNDDGIDAVEIFTNTQAGMIKGSTDDGKVYAESSGIGSVVGWDALKTRVSNLEINKADDVLATITNRGLLSAADFKKLSTIETGAQVNTIQTLLINNEIIYPVEKKLNFISGNNIVLGINGNNLTISANIPSPVHIDDALSGTSINPVQNKVIKQALDGKINIELAQYKITESNKLPSDLVDDSKSTTNKFISLGLRNQISINTNNISKKQNILTAGKYINITNDTISTSATKVSKINPNSSEQELIGISIDDTTYKMGVTYYELYYDITQNLTGVIVDSQINEIQNGGLLIYNYTATAGYSLPETITVVGATSEWNNGRLTISNPTADITITINGVVQ